MKRGSEDLIDELEGRKISYKPIPVRDLLVELKDTSEVMLDLAYSAVLFDDRELSEEVLELEKLVDFLTQLLEMNGMLATRDARDAESLLPVFKVASAADKVSDAAADIAVIVLKGIGIHPIVREAFRRVGERLTCVRVKPGSKLAGRRIGDLDLTAEIGVDIIAIRRGRTLIVDPEEDDIILEGDVIFARGAPEGIEKLEESEEKTTGESRLEAFKGVSMDTVEEIVRRFVELKDTSELMLNLAYSSILLGSYELAEEVMALEEFMDEKHVEFELLILSSGFKPEESRGVLGLIRLALVTEEIADAAAQIADIMVEGLEPHSILRKAIEESEETVVRVTVPEDSPLAGKTLREAGIESKTGMWIIAVKRGDRWIRPRSETTIEPGDTLVASGYADGVDDLLNLVQGSNPPVKL